MILQAIALALSAAALHATWNVRLKAAGDPLSVATRATVASAVSVAPLGCLIWLLTGRPGIPAGVWGLVVLSAMGELAYYIFLSAGYRRAEISHIYPVARGTAPVLAVLAGLGLGERLQWAGYLGVVLVLAGLLAIRPPRGAGSATIFAVLTGVCIAWYSTVDSIGVQHVQPWLYGWAIWTGAALFATAWVCGANWRRRRQAGNSSSRNAEDAQHRSWRAALAMGTLMALPYLLVLQALSWAPLMVVAPVRESAIVLVTVWSVLRLGERDRVGWRLGGAAAVVAGIALLAV